MATEFTKFPELPLELQRKIWDVCVADDRVMEFDCPNSWVKQTRCVMRWSSRANALQPSFSLVCHEAREAAFRNGGYLWNLHKFWKAKGFEQEPVWDYPSIIKNPWFNSGKDILHLNWDIEHRDYYEDTDDDNPIPTLMAYANVARGGSFMASLVQPFKKEYDYFCLQPWLHRLKKNFPLIEHMSGFKACLATINIHATAKQVVDARLFGSLAAPIQLVETSDRETIRRMYELWSTTFIEDAKSKDPEPEELFEEMVLTPDDFEARVCRWHEEVERIWLWYKWSIKFEEGTLNSIDSPRNVWTGPDTDYLGNPFTGVHPYNIRISRHDFSRAHPWVQSILDEMPRFRPVIIFRFCDAKCHIRTRPPRIGPVIVRDHHDFNYYAGREVASLAEFI